MVFKKIIHETFNDENKTIWMIIPVLFVLRWRDIDNEYSYLRRIVISFNAVKLFGDIGKEILGYLPNPNSDFLLTYLANKYGAVMVIGIVASVAAIIITGCIASAKSKNQLGLVMGENSSLLMRLVS